MYYLGIAFALTAIACSLWQGHEVAYPYYGYEQTVATVVKVEIEELMERPEDAPAIPAYRPKITREYSIYGEKFSGSAFSTRDGRIKNRKAAVALANSFKPGDSVTIFYARVTPRDHFWFGTLIGKSSSAARSSSSYARQ